MTQTNRPSIQESSESEIIFRSPGGWITVRRKIGSDFTWSERKHVNSVAIVAVRRHADAMEVQLHSEHNPAHVLMRKMNWGVCGGRLDKNKKPIAVAQDELREEGGIDCPINRIYDCGKVFASTQSSEHVFLFVADATGLAEHPLQLETEELEYGHANEWVSVEEAMARSEDPRLLCSLTRFKLQHQPDVFGAM